MELPVMLSGKIHASMRQNTTNCGGPEPALRGNLVGNIPQQDTAFPPQKLCYLLYYAFKTELQYKWDTVNLKSTILVRGKLCFVTVAFMFRGAGNRHFPNGTHTLT